MMTMRKRKITGVVMVGLALLGARSTFAQVAKQGNDTLSSLVFQSARLAPSQPIAPIENHLGEVAAATQSGWAAFLPTARSEWRASIDQRTGMIAFAEGGGVPWVPGHGNSLDQSDIAGYLKAGATAPDLTALEAIARSHLVKLASLLGVDAKSLVLSRGRSGRPAAHVWFIDFDVVRDGMTIEGARVVFRVNNGNLIQFGSENLPAPGTAVPPTRLTREQALAAVAKHIGGFGSADSFLDRGSLHLVPANLPSFHSAEGFDFGRGRGLAKVWQIKFHRDGVMGTWQARVDAATGEVLELADVNRYAQATGGIYQNSPTTGSEIVRPVPFADLSTGGFTSSAGLFTGGPLTSTLNGQYVRISDTCGAISLATNGAGDLVFGTSAGTDCTTPGFGGAGNTHASRQQFYQVNRLKEVGRGWLPGNTWLGQQLLVNVDLNLTCNAYWNGTSLNFFKSGGGCNNTGEIAGVSLHEYGHGLDQNDGGGFSTDGGESYADVTAALALHASCMGPGFFQSGNCGGYGDSCTACSGVRDIDYAKHVSNTPATVANFTQPLCPGGSGPCGREVHCESYVSSEAIWDLANRDLPGAGSGAAWSVLDRLWYLSRSTATTSFACHTGGTYTSDGCLTGSWWRTMRAIDDDDGNLANGTPHGGALFAAFNRHGIACATDPGATLTFAGCTAPTVPALSVTAGDNSASLSWPSSGAGVVYDAFRNETGCGATFTKIASSTSGTSLLDTAVANGTTYYYQVTAFPSGNEACASVPSTCIAVTPQVSSRAAGVGYVVPGGQNKFHLRPASGSGQIVVAFKSTLDVPIAGDWNGDHVHTTGSYVGATSTFYLRNTNSDGFADLTFTFGTAGAGWKPIAGDWDGDGVDTVGLYDPATGTFRLRNTNSSGGADVTFTFTGAASTWLPIAGDWDGNGVDTVGLYDPATSTFYLRNSNTTGSADVTFVFGTPGSGLLPVAGDWDGNGADSIGVYNPTTFLFSLKNLNASGPADVQFTFGAAGGLPVAGDWDGY